MMLGKFKKQPGETLDYPVSYSDFFSTRSDSVTSVAVTAEAGITLVSQATDGQVCKVVLSGGTDGATYKVTLRMTTTTGIIKEDEFRVSVKEI